MSQLTERYATALFELALQENALPLYQCQIKELIGIFTENNSIQSFFAAVQISTDEKKELLTKAFKGKIEPMIFNFLNLLVDKKRISHVVEIMKEFNTLCNRELNIREGIVYSARPLTQDQIGQLEQTLCENKNQKIELQNLIDERLISGIKVAMENQVIDLSMKNRIESLKNELLKESR